MTQRLAAFATQPQAGPSQLHFIIPDCSGEPTSACSSQPSGQRPSRDTTTEPPTQPAAPIIQLPSCKSLIDAVDNGWNLPGLLVSSSVVPHRNGAAFHEFWPNGVGQQFTSPILTPVGFVPGKAAHGYLPNLFDQIIMIDWQGYNHLGRRFKIKVPSQPEGSALAFARSVVACIIGFINTEGGCFKGPGVRLGAQYCPAEYLRLRRLIYAGQNTWRVELSCGC